MTAAINKTALTLFAPLADDYGVWSRVLSFGQDPRWRRTMVQKLALAPGARVLDVAAGTGEVSRLLRQQGYKVISLDQSPEMLGRAVKAGAIATLARAEDLPFPDQTFEALTFTYLLRYVDDPGRCLAGLTRVVRRGGLVAMVEFGRPGGLWGPLWELYTKFCLPLAGSCIGHGWQEVGAFLGPSITAFHRRFPPDSLARLWAAAGLVEVSMVRLSLGGGLIMQGRKP